MAWSRTPVEPLRWWVQKVLPTVYDDSLSFQELLGKVVNKLNEVIDNSEDLTDYVNEQLVNFELQLENFYNKQEMDEIVAQVTNQLGDKVDKLVELGKTVFYASVNGVQSGIEGTDEYDVGPKVAMYTDRGTLSVGDPITSHDAVSKQHLELELNNKVTKYNGFGANVYVNNDGTDIHLPLTATPTGDGIPRYNSNGGLEVSSVGSNDNSVVNKGRLELELNNKVTKYNGFGANVYVNNDGTDIHLPLTATPTGDGVPRYNSNGGLEVSSVGTNNNSVVNKGYFDTHGIRLNTVLSTAHTGTGELLRIDPTNVAFFIITFRATSTGTWYTTVLFNTAFSQQRYIMRTARDAEANTYIDISFSALSGSTLKSLSVTASNSSTVSVERVMAVMVD